MCAGERLRRVGVLTGGGDCPGLNAVIRAVVKGAFLQHGAEAVGVLDGFEGLITGRTTALSYNDVSGILTLGGTILGTSNRANPFAWVAPDGDPDDPRDVSDACARVVQEAGLDVLFCIGGDGTLSIAAGLAGKGIPVVGVPKTIDNDIYGTDVTFGFDSAVQIVAEAIDRLHTTAMAHHRVMVVETMGRYAGWLALVGGVAGGGDVILIPEIPYDLDAVCDAVRRRSKRGKRFSIVVVAEGVCLPEGGHVVRQRVEGSHEKVRLGGIGPWLASEIEDRTGVESRAVVLGHVQRGGSPTAYDRVLATRLGRAAFVEAARGNCSVMVGVAGQSIATVPLEEVAGRQRLVEDDCELVQAARAVGTSFGEARGGASAVP
jgi:phosphofructokinase-like protein